MVSFMGSFSYQCLGEHKILAINWFTNKLPGLSLLVFVRTGYAKYGLVKSLVVNKLCPTIEIFPNLEKHECGEDAISNILKISCTYTLSPNTHVYANRTHEYVYL
jgi:hypothetical protein